MMARDVTDFPDPDSPTMARVRPGFTSKLTSRTGWNGPRSVLNSTDNERTDRRGSLTLSESEPRSDTGPWVMKGASGRWACEVSTSLIPAPNHPKAPQRQALFDQYRGNLRRRSGQERQI